MWEQGPRVQGWHVAVGTAQCCEPAVPNDMGLWNGERRKGETVLSPGAAVPHFPFQTLHLRSQTLGQDPSCYTVDVPAPPPHLCTAQPVWGWGQPSVRSKAKPPTRPPFSQGFSFLYPHHCFCPLHISSTALPPASTSTSQAFPALRPGGQ